MVKWVFITLCSFLLSGCFFTKYIPFMGEDERPDLQPSSVSVAGAENDQLTVDVQQSFKNGENAYKAGKYQSARRHYEQALQADPELVDAMFRLGNIELREGKLDKAQLRYKSVIDLQPRNRRAHYNLALVYLIQSENHFKYFMAVSPEHENQENLLQLLSSMETFSNRKSKNASSLDSLAEWIRLKESAE